MTLGKLKKALNHHTSSSTKLVIILIFLSLVTQIHKADPCHLKLQLPFRSLLEIYFQFSTAAAIAKTFQVFEFNYLFGITIPGSRRLVFF